jgi:drug/metabolite transporter (DMT)-like permease
MDLLLASLVLIWGVNYSLLKRVFAQMDPMAFNAMRFALASIALVVGIVAAKRAARLGRRVPAVFHTPTPVTTRDRVDLLALGFVGQCAYQWGFSSGLARTSVSNSVLIMATTPVIVSTASAVMGHERLRPLHWCGIAISLAGVAVVVGGSLGGGTMTGDLLMGAAALCWALFTIGGTRLMARHSALYVSGVTTAIGTVIYAAAALPTLMDADWSMVDAGIWGVAAYAGLLSIAAAYLVWYAAIRRIGPARTSIYANMVPIAAMTIAAIWLHEPLTPRRIFGAVAVIMGVVLTRLARPSVLVPSEE